MLRLCLVIGIKGPRHHPRQGAALVQDQECLGRHRDHAGERGGGGGERRRRHSRREKLNHERHVGPFVAAEGQLRACSSLIG